MELISKRVMLVVAPWRAVFSWHPHASLAVLSGVPASFASLSKFGSR